MLLKLFNVLLVFLAMQSICIAKPYNEDTEIDLSHLLSIRDPETGIEYEGTFDNFKQDGSPAALMYKNLPCRCENSRCSCCSNIRTLHLSWNMCLNAVLRSEPPPLSLSLTVNDKVILEHNTPLEVQSYCFRIFDLDFLQICVAVKNIYFDGKGLHLCPEVRAKIFNFPEISLFYKCININADGISIEKFQLAYNRTVSQTEYRTNELKMLDKVDNERQDLEANVNYTSVHSPDEEVQIGQLKH